MKYPTVTLEQLENVPAFADTHWAASVSGIHQRTIELKCKSGEIPCVKFGNKYRINTAKFLEMLGVERGSNE